MFVCFQLADAQIQVRHNTNGKKLEELENVKKSLPNSLPTKILPSFDYTQLIAEDKIRESSGLPERYGKKFDVQWSTSNSGAWSNFGNDKIWHLKIHSPNAYSLGLLFEKFYLPEGATLLIYNEAESFMYGPLTSKSNKGHEQFSTGPIQGETIIVELTVPKILQNNVKLQINEVIHGYKDLFKTQLGYNDSGNCLDYNDVECFTAWDNESDAVARVINGEYYGSGALVNNTANDFTPYLLTAFHVIDVDQSGTINLTERFAIANCLFQFHYKSPTCNGSNSAYFQFTGGELIASYYNSDFALIEMDDSPVGNGNITYLGWDNRNNTPTSGTVIHHPSGDVMKISLSNTSPNIVGNFWEYQFYSGITEGGSSGGLVLNQNNKVVGQLLGTYSEDPISCDNQDGLTLYGRFDISWDGNNTNATQLAHWLDPNDTGNPTTNLIRSPSITVPDMICYSGTTVSMQNPPGVTITWGGTNVYYPSGNTGTSVTVRAASSSTSDVGTVTASFTVNGRADTITQQVWVGTTTIIGLDGSMSVPTNLDTRYYPLYSDVRSSPTNFEWNVTPDASYDSYGWSTLVNFPYPDVYQIVYRGLNTCGWGDWYYSDNIYVYSSRSLSISPNPASGETIISIETADKNAASAAETEETAFDETAEWSLEIYDNVQSLKMKKTSLKGRETTVNAQSWKEGVYFVRVLYKNEVLTGKLVVKK